MRLSTLMFLATYLLAISVSCSKKGATVAEQSKHNDTVVKIRPAIFVPYTDTFRGTLRVQYLCTMCTCADYDMNTDNYYFYVNYIDADSVVFESMDGIYGGPCAWRRKTIRETLRRSDSGHYAHSYARFLLSGDSLHVNWSGNGNSWRSTGGAELDDAYISFQGVLQ